MRNSPGFLTDAIPNRHARSPFLTEILTRFKIAEENAGRRIPVVSAGTSSNDVAWEHVKHGAGEHTLRGPTLTIDPQSYLVI